MIEIRQEQVSDIKEIRKVTELAFRDMPFSGGDEQDVIDRLRQADALSLSLVAVQGDHLLGHVAFSPVNLDSRTSLWFALGPVSVTPEFQHQGIGSSLIRNGLGQLEEQGAAGCILTGNPEYYRRFGFQLAPGNCPDCEPAEYFMVKRFAEKSLSGKFAFHKAFYGVN